MDATESLWTIIENGGVVAIFFLLVVGVVRGWWVPRWHYDELKKSHDEWKQIALQGQSLADRGARAAEDVVTSAVRLQRIEEQIRRMAGSGT